MGGQAGNMNVNMNGVKMRIGQAKGPMAGPLPKVPEPDVPEPVDPNPVDPNPVDPIPLDPNPADPDPVTRLPFDPVIVDPRSGGDQEGLGHFSGGWEERSGAFGGYGWPRPAPRPRPTQSYGGHRGGYAAPRRAFYGGK